MDSLSGTTHSDLWRRKLTDPSAANPYAPPGTADFTGARSARTPSVSRKFVFFALLFAAMRGVASGFATLILLVHLSGTQIHWHNATPILAVALLGCLVLHWVEMKFRLPTSLVLMIGVCGYLIGIAVVTVAGILDNFPTPF